MDRQQAQELIRGFESARGLLSANYHLHLAAHGPECDIIACAEAPGLDLGSMYAVQWHEYLGHVQDAEAALLGALMSKDAVAS